MSWWTAWRRTVVRAETAATSGSRSAKVCREHSAARQKNRRTVISMRTARPGQGKSASVRVYRLWTRVESSPHWGQGLGEPIARAIRVIRSPSIRTSWRVRRAEAGRSGGSGEQGLRAQGWGGSGYKPTPHCIAAHHAKCGRTSFRGPPVHLNTIGEPSSVRWSLGGWQQTTHARSVLCRLRFVAAGTLDPRPRVLHGTRPSSSDASRRWDLRSHWWMLATRPEASGAPAKCRLQDRRRSYYELVIQSGHDTPYEPDDFVSHQQAAIERWRIWLEGTQGQRPP
jgi:hypothetical protein